MAVKWISTVEGMMRIDKESSKSKRSVPEEYIKIATRQLQEASMVTGSATHIKGG